MSCGQEHELPCVEVLSSVIVIADGEIDLLPQWGAIEIHLGECPECAAELEHEKQMHALLQEALKRTSDEKAPQELHESLHQQFRQGFAGATEIITEFSMTEVSIEIDEFGNISTHEIHIEHTQEYRIHEDE